MHVAITCIALLGFLLFGLGFAVSLTRGRAETLIGNSPDPANLLHKLVRAHGNTAEYAPLLAVLMLVVAMNEPAPWTLWCMGIATAARYVFALGMVTAPTLAKPHPLRFVGALGTYLTGIALCVALVI